MLNPQRWGANANAGPSRDGYVQDFDKGAEGTLFEIGVDEDEEEEESRTGTTTRRKWIHPGILFIAHE